MCCVRLFRSLEFDEQFTFVMGTNRKHMPQILEVHLVFVEGNEQYSLGNNLPVQCHASLTHLEHKVTVDEWYTLHGITGDATSTHGKLRLQLMLVEFTHKKSSSKLGEEEEEGEEKEEEKEGDKDEEGLESEPEPQPELELESGPGLEPELEPELGLEPGPRCLQAEGPETPRQEAPTKRGGVFGFFRGASLLNLMGGVTKKKEEAEQSANGWASKIWLSKNSHLHYGADQAAKIMMQASETDKAVVIMQHMLNHTQMLCIFFIILNQFVNHNFFSSVLTLSLFGCVLCEHPNIPSGYWSGVIHFLHFEIFLRYCLTLYSTGLTGDCEAYVPNSNTEQDGSSFLCSTVNVNASITLLLLLLTTIYLHRYRMKRQGIWQYWTAFHEKAEKAHFARALAEQLKAEDVGEREDEDDSDDEHSGKKSEGCFGCSEKKGEKMEAGPKKDRIQVLRTRTESGTAATELVQNDDAEEEKPSYTLHEAAEINFFAFQLRLGEFFGGFIENTLYQNDPLPLEVRKKILKDTKKSGKFSMEDIDAVLSSSKRESGGAASPSKTEAPEGPATDGSVGEHARVYHSKTAGAGADTMARLLRRSSYKTPVDYYGGILMLELLSLFLVFAVEIQSKDQDISSLAVSFTTSGFSGTVLILTLVQFGFIVADRAAFLGQSITIKFAVIWVSLVFYMILMFAAYDFVYISIYGLFWAKVSYWYLSCVQIRNGFQHDATQKKTKVTTGLFAEFGSVNQYAFTILYNMPFALDITTALTWIFKSTTLRWEDARKLDEIYAMSFMIQCRYARDDEDKRLIGHPQGLMRKLKTGVVLLIQFILYIWGPMLIFSVIQSIEEKATNNVVNAALSMDVIMAEGPLKLFETSFAEIQLAQVCLVHTALAPCQLTLCRGCRLGREE